MVHSVKSSFLLKTHRMRMTPAMMIARVKSKIFFTHRIYSPLIQWFILLNNKRTMIIIATRAARHILRTSFNTATPSFLG